MKFFALLLATLLAVPAFAQNSDDCVDRDRASKEILSAFEFYADSSSFVMRACKKDNELSYGVLKALLFLKDLPRLSDQVSSFRPGFLDANAYGFFRKRIKSIVFESANSEVCKSEDGSPSGTAAYVWSNERSSHIMHVCPLTGKMDTLMIASILVHEARHIDGYSHVACDMGPLKGQDGCDSSYQSGGSYSVGAEFAVMVAQAPDLNPVLKMRARGQAIQDFIERFNRKPFGARSGVLVQDASGQVAFFDGEKETPFNLGPMKDRVLTLRFGIPAVFDLRTGKAMSYMYSSELAPTGGMLAQKAKEQISKGAKLMDVNYGGDEYACLLFAKSVGCTNGEVYIERQLGEISPVSLIYSENSIVVRDGYMYVSAADGYLYELPKKFESFASSRASEWKRSSQVYDLLGLSTWLSGKDLGLKRDGQISSVAQVKGTWSAHPQFQGKRYERLVGPFLWSKKLEDL